MPEEQPRSENPPEKSVRLQRREARMKRVKDAREPRKVRVTPTRESLRAILKHPNAGAFRSSGSLEWPYDSFTRRRIRDGDVTVEKREQNKPPERTQAEPQQERTQAEPQGQRPMQARREGSQERSPQSGG